MRAEPRPWEKIATFRVEAELAIVRMGEQFTVMDEKIDETFDCVVIGGGSAGYAAARTAREAVERVAIVDAGPELGGLCILRGCMPSKTLIYSAEVLHLARQANLFGLKIPEASMDMQGLHERKLKLIDDFKSYRVNQLESDRFTLFREKACFISKDTIELQDSKKRISGKKFIVATGSNVNWPKVPGLDQPGIWTSDDVLDLDFLPESVIVLGGGIVACELAQFLKRAGSKVIQIQRSPIVLKETSPEAAEVIMKAFQDEGVDLYTDTDLEKIEKNEEGFCVTFKHKGKSVSVSARYLFNALGRFPNAKGLGLKHAQVETTNDREIFVNQFQQTTNPDIYAAGDVCGPFEVVHIAILQAEAAARHATGRDVDPVDYSTRTTVVFTDPQIGQAGLPFDEAKAQGIDLVCADYPFDDHGKSMLMHATYGYVKVWADKANARIVGAECVGKDGGELIHAMAVAITMKATARDLLKVHWYHPTLSEIWSYPLEDIVEALEG